MRKVPGYLGVFVQCLGFGAFLAALPNKWVGVATFSTVAPGFDQTMLGQGGCYLVMGLWGLVLGMLLRKGIIGSLRFPFWVAAGVALVAIAAFAGIPDASHSQWVGAVLLLVESIAWTSMFFVWMETLLDACYEQGEASALLRCVGAYLVSLLLSLVFEALLSDGGTWIGLVVQGALIATSCACKHAIDTLSEADFAYELGVGNYKLTLYSFLLLVCFGVMHGVASCAFFWSLRAGASDVTLSSVVPVVSCIAFLIVVGKCSASWHISYGQGVRISIAVMAATLASLPLASMLAPLLAAPLATTTSTIAGVTIIMFSIYLCYESGIDSITIISKNYAVYAVSYALTQFIGAMVFTRLDAPAAWCLASLLAVLSALAIIPFLPSRSSTAMAFTNRSFVEEESFEGRVARACSLLSERYGLTNREREVLELLLKGMSRQQIATELNLSTWTVRDHVGRIYNKTGIHSARKLMALVSSGRNG